MYAAPQPSATPGVKQEKPNLVGVRNKQRKGVQKAQAKFEPLAFRDQLIKHLESVPEHDFDAVASKLDVLGNQLDYRKYEQQLFELLLVGGLLAPGGGFLDDGAAKSTFSVTGSAKEPVEVSDVKSIVDVFNKLTRRYKYLQKGFEETALPSILQYSNKFSQIDQEKLAVATALFVAVGLVSASVVLSLKKDHLVKDGTSVRMLTSFLKAFLATESIEQLSLALRKGGVTDLEAFFPPSKQNATELSTHFKGAGLSGVVDFYIKQKAGKAKEDTLARLREYVSDEADYDEIMGYLEAVHKRGILSEPEFISIAWAGLTSGIDMGAKPELLPDLAVKEIKSIAPLLEPFNNKPATEVALINTIQIWCYENTKLMPAFAKILKVLYSLDVLSDQAILYWHSKGSKTQARQHFLDAAGPLVNFLKEQEEEEDESDDE
ncbi:BZ3500_MvSof-1268-A1-R1_Chr9g10358 [Microbotryum saponariae]|uniref:BZ3500_MvSof-1268-A1-R1_Chr9g10358 protein n=1 Tax=Microbotryum saponariae TaxID=289078 RepID=A0A2X0KSY1_9BASI|nr:BZ3501_MvSof-1269-A2-R1_Chr9g10108 [Microbotryum saponariae]SCZ99960.1 BZ3500_MvSof-1268-A1-R1_Chr9g10358 [Microbotryum saponariae]